MKILNAPPSVGEMIQELYLLPSGLSSEEAAKMYEIDTELFEEILTGEVEIGYELAYKLSKGFNTTHNFWLNIQRDHQSFQGK